MDSERERTVIDAPDVEGAPNPEGPPPDADETATDDNSDQTED